MIIGESLVRIRSYEPNLLEEIPDAQAIIGFLNVLVHAFDATDSEAVFELAGGPLCKFRMTITKIIDEG